jgi:uncharacterized NAD-dependent epimerase/dehydratase family protein
MDCVIGKRTTATHIVDVCNQRGLHTELIFTGQTGCLQGVAKYGFLLDATVNDFVNGELEYAIVTCFNREMPSLIVVEGQSSMRAPAGPGGPALLLSGGCRGVVLQHQPTRRYYLGLDREPFRLPPVEDEIELIERYGAKVLAVSLNTSGLDDDRIETTCRDIEQATKLPAVLPMRGDADRIFSFIKEFCGHLRLNSPGPILISTPVASHSRAVVEVAERSSAALKTQPPTCRRRRSAQ